MGCFIFLLGWMPVSLRKLLRSRVSAVNDSILSPLTLREQGVFAEQV